MFCWIPPSLVYRYRHPSCGPVVVLATAAGCPFAVVPCCVFPKLFPHRKIKTGEGVRQYSSFIKVAACHAHACEELRHPFCLLHASAPRSMSFSLASPLHAAAGLHHGRSTSWRRAPSSKPPACRSREGTTSSFGAVRALLQLTAGTSCSEYI